MSNAKSGSRPSRHPRPQKDTKAERASAPAAAATSETTSQTRHARDADLPPAAVETFAIEKDYGGVPALAPLDLAVEPGESVVLIGHNGSGKTTLLRMAGRPARALERQRAHPRRAGGVARRPAPR